MYLRKVSLRDWGCHETLAVEFTPGLNVCVGPNGAGKSTLYQAILTALTVKYNSTSQDLDFLKSWGKDGFGPSVVLEVSRSEGDWRLSKTFIHERICTLEREGRSEHFKNQEAEQALGAWREDDGAAGRLMLELWSDQHDPIRVFDPDAKPKAQTRAHLIEQIMERAGRPDVSGPFAHIKKIVSENYDKVFTAKQNKIKINSDLDHAEKGRKVAERDLAQLRLKREGLDAKSAAYAARSGEHEDACRARDALRREQAERTRRGADYRAKRDALNEARQRADTLRQRFQEQDAEHQRLRKVEQEIQRAEAALRDLVPTVHDAEARSCRTEGALSVAAARVASALEELDPLAVRFERRAALIERIDRTRARAAEHDAARAAFEQAASAAEQAAADLEAAREESVQADRVREAVALAAKRRAVEQAETSWRQAESECRRAEASALSARREGLRDRLRLVRGWLADLEALDPAGDGGPIPSAQEIKELARQNDLLIHQSEALEGDALTVRFAPSAALQAEFSGDGAPPESHDLGPGQFLEKRTWAGFTLEIAGVGRIEVGRSSADPTVRLEQWRSGRARLADGLRKWQAPSVAALEERQGRDRDRRELQARVALQLDGKTGLEIETELAEFDRRLAELGTGPDDPAPPAPSSGWEALRKQRDEADRRRAAAQALCQDAAALEADPTLPDALPEPAAAEQRAAAARKQLAAVEKRCKEAERERVRAETDLKNVSANLNQAEQDLADEAHGEDPRDALAQIDRKIEDKRAILAQYDAQVVGEQTRASVEVVKQRLTKALEGTRDERDSALAALNEWKQKSIAAQTLLENHNRHRSELLQAAARDGKAETREDDLNRLREEWQEAEAEVKLLQKALPANPDVDAEEFNTRWQQAEAGCQKGEIELATLGSELVTLGNEGLDTQLVLAEEKYDQCRRDEEDARRKAASWAVLHHLLREVEENQSKQVAEQVAALSGLMVSRLTGGNADGVTFDGSSLVPLEARVPRAGLSAKLDRFSRGTREQVALACRLQIGLLLGRQFRHMLLLDDPLAHTDPTRHAAALDVLEELAETLQLIVFTCHADRYRPLWDRGQTRRIEIGGEIIGES